MVIAAGPGTAEFSSFSWFRIESGSVKERQDISAMAGIDALVKQLVNLEVDVLLLNQVPEEVEMALIDGGIAVITGVKIPADQAVAAYIAGDLIK